MKNRLKHNVKFCEKDEMFDFSNVDFIRNFNGTLIGKCIKIYKSYTTQYRFRITEYDSNYNVVKSKSRNFERPKLNSSYQSGELKEVEASLLAKIKLMER